MIRRHVLLLLALTALLLASGCGPKVKTAAVQSSASGANIPQLITEIEKDERSRGELWYWLNLGRLYQVEKNHQKSIEAFGRAETILDEYESRARISLRNVGSSAGSLLFSKGAETYYGKGYERTLLHTLNGLNYLMLRDFESAAVEMRKMEKRQEFWLLEHEARIQAASDEAKAKHINTSNIPQGYSLAGLLQTPHVRDLVNNYQDPFSYCVSGLVCRLAGDPEYAEVSFRRAVSLSDEAGRALGELAVPASQDDGDAETPLATAPPSDAPDGSVEATLIVLGGLAPALKVESLRIPIGNLNYTVIELPGYHHPQNNLLQVFAETGGRRIEASKLLVAERYALRTLSDEMTVELVKAFTRAAARGAAAYAAGSAGKNQGQQALIGLMTSLVMDVASTQLQQSFRNWEMLPNYGYLARFRAGKGTDVTLTLNGIRRTATVPADADKGVIFLVSYLNPSDIRIEHATY